MMVEYENYESLLGKKSRENKKQPKKMKRPVEDRARGRKLNHRTKKNKAKDF